MLISTALSLLMLSRSISFVFKVLSSTFFCFNPLAEIIKSETRVAPFTIYPPGSLISPKICTLNFLISLNATVISTFLCNSRTFSLIFSSGSVSGQSLSITRQVTPTARVIQDRLRQKFAALLSGLIEQGELTNPVTRIGEIIDEIPIDDAIWRKIVEEPYG